MRRRNDGAGVSPQEEFGDVCFHALGIIDQNREYLQMHLLASADLPTRQALSDIQIESARLDRTVRNAITLYQLENEELSELQPLDLCGLLEKAGRLAPDIQRSLEITLTTESGGIEHCAVMGVPDEAEQLLLHLISNALRAGNGTPLRRGERHPRSAVRKPGGTGDPSAAEILNETKRHLQCGRDGAAQMPLLCVRDREESRKIDRR